MKRSHKTGSNIITDIENKEPEQPMGDIFINRFGEAKDIIEKKKMLTGFLGFKKEA